MRYKFVDLILLILRYRKVFVINFIIFALGSIGISLVLPYWYTSTARLLPPESQQGDFLGLASLVANIPFEIPGVGGLGTGPSDVYLAILRSRNVRESVLNRLDLYEYFEAEAIEDALATLDSRTKLDKTEENLIVVNCTERTPELSQSMVQVYLEELDRVNREVRRTTASYSREFIEKRLVQAETDLQDAAQRLADFQGEYGAFDIENQVKAQIEAAAQIRGELVLLEIQKNVLKSYVSERHDELRNLEAKVQETQNQLEKLQNGVSPIKDDLLLSFREVPKLGKDFLFLKRDVEVQKVIYQLLMQQFEQAKIQEAKDSPTIQILDAPTLAQKRSSPKRSIIVLTSVFVSVLLSMVVVWTREFMANLSLTDGQKYQQLVAGLRNAHKISGPTDGGG